MEHHHTNHCCCENHHEEDCHCSCEHHHADYEIKVTNLTRQQEKLLLLLGQLSYSPMVKFIMKSSKSNHLEALALPCVYLTDRNDSFELVKDTAGDLEEMEDMGLLTLDDDIPLSNYDYNDYYTSAAFAYFNKTMEESAQNETFLFDIADLEKGSIALTDLGRSLFHEIATK